MNIKNIVVLVFCCTSSLCAQYNTFSESELKFKDGYTKLLEGDANAALEIFRKEIYENKNYDALPYYRTAACGATDDEGPSNKELVKLLNKARRAKNSWSSALVRGKKFKEYLPAIKAKAEDGNVVAQFELSIAYGYGIVTKKNKELAFKYLKMAVDQGLDCAKFALGTYYAEGVGVDVDLVKAEELIVSAMENHPRKYQIKYFKKLKKKLEKSSGK